MRSLRAARRLLPVALVSLAAACTREAPTALDVAGARALADVAEQPAYTVSNLSLVGTTFTVTVTNTSTTGVITSIGFALPGDRSTFALVAGSHPAFRLENDVRGSTDGVRADYDLALLTGPNFNGGRAAAGLLPGQSATFTVMGDFSGLTAEQIASVIAVRLAEP